MLSQNKKIFNTLRSFSIIWFIIFLPTGFASAQSVEKELISDEPFLQSNDVRLYPNPTQKYLNIEIERSTLDHVEFEMYNIIGNKMPINIEETGDDQFKISVKDYFPGYYILVVKDRNSRFNQAYRFRKTL